MINSDYDIIYLAQTDTTVGFLSKDKKSLNRAKNRDELTSCIKVVSSCKKLKAISRVPKRFKNLVRKSQKTTLIYPNNNSIRLVKDGRHELFLNQFDFLYSTSANITGKSFDENYARSVADEIVDETLHEKEPSKIYKISKTTIKKVRS